MSTKSVPVISKASLAEQLSKLISQYGCGPIQFAGTHNGLYERHLLFDNVADLGITDAREHYEAFAVCPRHLVSTLGAYEQNLQSG